LWLSAIPSQDVSLASAKHKSRVFPHAAGHEKN